MLPSRLPSPFLPNNYFAFLSSEYKNARCIPSGYDLYQVEYWILTPIQFTYLYCLLFAGHLLRYFTFANVCSQG